MKCLLLTTLLSFVKYHPTVICFVWTTWVGVDCDTQELLGRNKKDHHPFHPSRWETKRTEICVLASPLQVETSAWIQNRCVQKKAESRGVFASCSNWKARKGPHPHGLHIDKAAWATGRGCTQITGPAMHMSEIQKSHASQSGPVSVLRGSENQERPQGRTKKPQHRRICNQKQGLGARAWPVGNITVPQPLDGIRGPQ